MLLTKSDFLKYKECSSYAWFVKNMPDVLSNQEIDPFVQGLIEQGAEVEDWARESFPNGVQVKSYHEKAVTTTKQLIEEGNQTIFQATFSDKELYAMVDILDWNDKLQAWDIYEVKSSTSQQDTEGGKMKDEHLYDAGFQRILLKRLGMKIANVFLIQLNKKYIKNGEINIDELFAITEITADLINMEESLNADINVAYNTIHLTDAPKSCSCKIKPRKKHCGVFSYLYPDTPEYSVYDIYRIGNSPTLLRELEDQNILQFSQIKDLSKFNKMRLWQWQTYVNNEEIILADKIQAELDKLVYPLYFLDYETLPAAIPKYDGTSPHQQVVFQYSLHIITSKDADPIHKEYLHKSIDPPMQSVASKLREDIGDAGSVIVWYKPFESSRTKELADMVPGLNDFLISLNKRIYDLMDIVANGYYVHKDFKGSASIKAVLPVMCPDLSYKDLNIQNGGQAMTTYRDLIFSDKFAGNENQVEMDLLEYCKLDTWAMVRIWEEFCKKV